MPKTNKNIKQALPQKTFIAASIAAYILGATFSLALVIRVYSSKQIWLSPFLAMSISEILLPIALFSITYLALRKHLQGLSLDFTATLLAVMGVLLHTLISQIYFLPMPSFGMWNLQTFTTIGFLITSAIIVSIVKINSRRRDSQNIIHCSFIWLTIGLYLLQAIFTAKDAIWRYTHGHDASQLLMDASLTHSLVLPLTFFIIAYLMITKTYQASNKLLATTIYTTIGFLITLSLTSTWMISNQIFPSGDTDYDVAIGVVAPLASLAIYMAIITRHKFLNKRGLKY